MIFFYRRPSIAMRSWQKLLIIMKLVIILLFTGILQIHAAAYSQNTYNFNEQRISVKQMFKKIEKAGKYTIFYRLDQVKLDQKVQINIKDASIDDVMKQVLQNQVLAFQVMGDIIVIKPLQDKNAADQTITGTVTDASNLPVPGVTVKLKGSTIAASTDAQGKYSITIPNANAVLVFTFLGFTTQEVSVNGQTVINIKLVEESKSLNEVVIVGYATQKKKDLTGAVTVVNMADLVKTPTSSINNQLQGQAAGVSVIGSGQPGQEPQVHIRGLNTFGNNTPLYVIDGVPTTDVSTLNPNDVENMQVLKDAGSASIYGSRASNGVIIITTKRGKGKVKIQYDAYYGSQVPKGGNVWHTLSSQEMANLKREAEVNSGVTDFSDQQYGDGPTYVLPDYIAPAGAHNGDASVNPSLYYVNPFYTDPNDYNNFYRITKANKTGTDWFHEVFKTAPITSHNLSLSAGTDQGSYLFSLNYYNQQGTLINTYEKRYTMRSNSQYNVSKHIRVGENLAYSVIDNPQVSINNPDAVIAHAFREQPIIPVYDIKGNYAGSDGPGLGDSANPVAIQQRTKNDKSLSYRLFGNAFAEADLVKSLTLRTSFGGELNSSTAHSFTYPTYENAENSSLNQYSVSSTSGYDYTWTNTLSYHEVFGKNDIKALVGTEANRNGESGLSGSRQNYYSFDPNYVNLSTGAAAGQSNSSYHNPARSLFSYIGRIDYAFDDKYLLSGVIRRDGSSAFVSQYGWFPAISAGWRISQENFMKNISWISDLKLRGGYGILGNQLNITSGNQFTNFSSAIGQSYYGIDGTSIIPGYYESDKGNPAAKWEKDINSNVGIDATLFHDMVSVTIDYYRKDIRDLLFNPTLPGTYGDPNPPFVNIAKMKNTGIDASITGNFKIRNDFKINATLSLTTYNNKILKVATESNYFDDDFGRRVGTNLVRNQVGHSIGEFYGYKVVGFWNSQAEIDAANAKAQKATGDPSAVYETDMGVGRFKYADVNGDGQVTDADRTFLGNPNPKFSTGLNLGVNYKQWDFSIFLYGNFGNKVWNNVKYWRDFYSSFGTAKSHTALYDSWTPTHMNASAPIQELGGYFSTNGAANSYFIENGTYLRAKNAQIGYTFSSAVLKKISVQKLRVYLSAANLFTITKYSGVDPELPGTTTDFGVDEGTYSSSRTFLIGVNLSL
ncbi:TonB-linked outer membrane protein, SusC/RagA family [Mucilaginibacter sp. OK098]|nr:TonB-linked outer membrane protein, SusC/RagA family [Mucilaginibacter sp. OK098]